jgi:hypothetical protein
MVGLGNLFDAIVWNPISNEIATHTSINDTYSASKKYAELAVWEWAEAHPHVDVTTSKSNHNTLLLHVT